MLVHPVKLQGVRMPVQRLMWVVLLRFLLSRHQPTDRQFLLPLLIPPPLHLQGRRYPTPVLRRWDPVIQLVLPVPSTQECCRL